MKKLMIKVSMVLTLIIAEGINTLAEPGFNEAEARNLVERFTNPFTSFLLWAVPIVCTIGCITKYLTWMGKDDDEKEQKPIFKSIKKYIFWAVVIELIAAVMKIFGL